MKKQSNFKPNDQYYYLPVSYETVQKLLQGSVTIEALSIPELAAVLALQNLPELAGAEARTEIGLSKAIEVGLGAGRETLAQVVAMRLSLDELQKGLDMVQELPVYLLEQDDVIKAGYLTGRGKWDFSYRIRKAAANNTLSEYLVTSEGDSIPVTGQQHRLLNQLRIELDEHIHLQGLAGVGKTTLIRVLMQFLRPETTLLLAQTTQQLGVLAARLGEKQCHASLSFGQLASQVIYAPGTGYPKPNRQRYSQTYRVSDAQAAKLLGISPVAGMAAARVAEVCRRTVQSFCYSTNDAICESNLPETGIRLDAVDKAVLIKYSLRMWNEIVYPQHHVEGQLNGLPIRVYHLLKILSLDENLALRLGEYTHIVIDEAHNLPGPLVKFLDRCPQAICTLGDTYQRLDGSATRRGSHVRQREISQSVRSGPQMETVLNPLIEAIPTQAPPLIGGKGQENCDTSLRPGRDTRRRHNSTCT